VGIRYGTPFGPLRADLAMRLPNDWRPNVNFAHRFPTVPGDSVHRENIVALQVTLGEAF
jgi:outer membrane protein assembly factor BamA